MRRVLATVLFVLAGCGPAAPPLPQPETDDWFSVYFTNPDNESLRGGPDSHLEAAIDAADQSVDVAVYRLDLWSIRDALLRAHDRGLRVRVVTETEYDHDPEINQLRAAGIPIDSDEREHLMHHKFAVIDGEEVWTGSMNFTVSGAYRNDNNLVRLELAPLAEQYTEEFNDMFRGDEYGALSRSNGRTPELQEGDETVWAVFAPEDGVAARIVDLLYEADQSIHILAYNLTLDEIADALIGQARSGVEVHGVFERDQADNSGGEFFRLQAAGLDVGLDGNSNRMHHKVIVVDSEWVITGSYNFSSSAEERNDENVVFIRSPELASYYLLEFERIRALASY